MSEVVVAVSLQASPGRGDDLVAMFTPGIEATHKEEGCVRYALHRDSADPDHFVHVEVWRSQADLDEHFKQPHLAELLAGMATPGLLAGRPAMWFTTPVPIGDPAKGHLT